MRNYKLIASDLDGTLLNNNMVISKENMLAIKELTAQGVHFVPASGRTVSEIPAELRNNPDVRYIIHSNGAAVYDKVTGDSIFMCISNDLSSYILDILKRYDTHITVRHNGNSYVDSNQQSEDDYIYYNMYRPHREVINKFAVYKSDLANLCRSWENIEMFAVFFNNDADMKECKKLLLNTGKLLVAEAFPHNLEIFSINAGKGNALHKLADMLNIDYADTISVGDSSNDITITQAAGLGLAMDNACDEIKKVADEIICNNDEHAILYIQLHYFKEGIKNGD